MRLRASSRATASGTGARVRSSGSGSPAVDRREVLVFAFYFGLTVVSGILTLLDAEPRLVVNGLALTAALVGGGAITLGSVRQMLKKNVTVNLLASLAIWVSVAVGEYLAAAIVVVMLNGGALVEEYASRRAFQAIERLIESAPLTARVLSDGREVEIPAEEVRVGDIAIVKSGDKIPLDGLVIKGRGYVNQAPITGESMPSEKNVGSEVFGNTFLEDGALDIRVTKAYDDTIFAHIIKLLKEAQGNRAPIERLADRYAKLFVPVILGLAMVTQLLTGNTLATASVLVIACPCALVLATPVAMAAGIGNAAKNSILIKGGQVLEKAGTCDLVVVDKTGTVTLGRPKVVDVKAFDGHSEAYVVELAAVAEKRSEHALARAILEKAGEWGVSIQDPSDFEVLPGQGVKAYVRERMILVGNRKLVEDHGVELGDDVESYLSSETDGKTAVLVAEGSTMVGAIRFSDTLREDVPPIMNLLRGSGVKKVIMMTGDDHQTAKRIAVEAGIDEVYAGMLPEDKTRQVKLLQDQGYRVLMVGDGINDAPALATADVGVAMGVVGTDVAAEAAGAVLTTDDLSKVSKVVRLGRDTLRVIRLNVMFALSVNVLGIALSTMGFLSPTIASAVHEGNALIVVFNSLRLAAHR